MTTPSLKVTGINHVVLHVSDLERSERFYVDVLGFESRRSGGSSARRASFLRCGTQGLDLFEVAGDVHGGKEMNHMALCVDTDEIDEAVKALTTVGIEISEVSPRNTVFIHDPDGHQIEILPTSTRDRAAERAAAGAA